MPDSVRAPVVITAFIILAFALTYLFALLSPLFSGIYLPDQPLSAILASYGPALAGVAAAVIFCGDLRGFGWGPGRARYYLFAVAFPLIMYPVYHGILSLAGYFVLAGGVNPDNMLLHHSAGLIAMCVVVTGEEIGLRGFLVPHVARWTGSFLITGPVTGVVRAVWHYPSYCEG